jgi:hypothetical protein
MGVMDLAVGVFAGGTGFLVADGLDRFLATFNPTAAERPKDKFVSDGAGTLANVLNIGSRPSWVRAGAATGMIAVPAIGAAYVRNRTAKMALEGLALGAGINGLKLLFSNVLLPLLIGKDTSTPAIQKSVIARLYPAEVAAHINMTSQKAGGNAAGMLSGKDVGPFAMAGDSPYPSATDALRRAAGVSGDSPYPDAAQALRHGVSGDSPYPDANQALRRAAGVGYEPGPPSDVGPGPKADPHTDPSCGCGDPLIGSSMFLGESPST